MSKIQEFFSAGGRRLFDSEKPVVDAFNDKYGHALAGAALSQPRAEHASPQSDQNQRAAAVRALTGAARRSEQMRALAGSMLTQTYSGSYTHRAAISALGNDRDVRASQSVGAKSRTMKRLNIVTLPPKRLGSQKVK